MISPLVSKKEGLNGLNGLNESISSHIHKLNAKSFNQRSLTNCHSTHKTSQRNLIYKCVCWKDLKCIES